MNKRSRLFVTVFFSTPVTFQDVKEQYFVKSGRRNAPVFLFRGALLPPAVDVGWGYGQWIILCPCREAHPKSR